MGIKTLNVIFWISLATNIHAQKSDLHMLRWGTMKFGDTLLIDHSEIRAGEWLDYVYYVNLNEFPSYTHGWKLIGELEKEKLTKIIPDISNLPDSNILKTLPYNWIFNKCNKCSFIEFSSVGSKIILPIESDSIVSKEQKQKCLKLLDLPIVGISFDQAVNFCRWRTSVDSLHYTQEPRVVYSLPSQLEFDLVNPSQDSIANKKGIVSNFNYRNAKYSDKKCKREENTRCGKTIMEYYSFFSSSKNVSSSTVDMQGNVAEMTTEEGIAKGGSYYHYAMDSYRGKVIHYGKPEPWLGFRCVGKYVKR